MKKEIITLPTNDSKIYKQILAFMNFTLRITPQEREVLAELIKLNHEYEGLPDDKRAKFILSTDMRKETREKLKIEEKQFNVIISKLRNKTYFGKPILDSDSVLHKDLLFKPDEEGFQIDVRLVIQKKKKKEEVKEEKKEETKEVKEEKEEKKLAPPANGTDGIIENEWDSQSFEISPPSNE
jgi:hypothetical protein